MGIYDNGSIFGIRIYNFNEDEFANILFEKTYNEIIKMKNVFNIILNVVTHMVKELILIGIQCR